MSQTLVWVFYMWYFSFNLHSDPLIIFIKCFYVPCILVLSASSEVNNISLDPHNSLETDTIISFILRIRKWRRREAKWLFQNQMAEKWQSQDSNPDVPDSSLHPSSQHFAFFSSSEERLRIGKLWVNKIQRKELSLSFKALAQCFSKPVPWITCIRIFLWAYKKCTFLDPSPRL